MPRKPTLTKQTIQVIVNGKPIAVVLHPPTAARKSWYAYWNGLVASKSTGQPRLEDAITAAEVMFRRWKAGDSGHRAVAVDASLLDADFEAIQLAHFSRRKDPAGQARSAKTLEETLDAIAAFKSITGLEHIAQATPDDCARFQTEALTRPKNWRSQHPKSKKTDECISPNTVLKWSRSLQAAFERANRSAGKKCVRGVVDEGKLLPTNPWTQFGWRVEATKRPIRQFDSDDLLSLLTHLEADWVGVPLAALAAKVFLWSACRKLEVASLTWDALRPVGSEVHFEVVGKHGIERWFRVPEPVYRELLAYRTGSPFVFASYTDQIRAVHADNRGCLKKIKDEFLPKNFGRWFYERVKEWSKTHPKGRAFVHHFRKTGLQHARRGEDINRQVAADARVGEGPMMSSYVKETDEEMRARSNRTFRRILASLPPEVARRYGHIEEDRSELEKRLQAATEAKDWGLVAAISARLAQARRPEVG